MSIALCSPQLPYLLFQREGHAPTDCERPAATPVLPSLCEGVLCPFTSFSEFTLGPGLWGRHMSLTYSSHPQSTTGPGGVPARLVLEVWRKQRASP